MKKVPSVLFLLAALAFFTGCASAPDGPLVHRGLPNFVKVDSHLYRGAQPSAEGVDELRKWKIATIVNLRASDGDPKETEAEENAARTAGIRYVSVPMNGWFAPTRRDVKLALSILSDPTMQPVFIHCRRGSDRTGTVVAIYRITQNGWSADQAMREAKELGIWRMEFGMRRFIRGWHDEELRQGYSPTTDGKHVAEGGTP